MRLIDAEPLEKRSPKLRELIKAQPTIEIENVKPGCWIEKAGHARYECSRCKTNFTIMKKWKWCPVCGALMLGTEPLKRKEQKMDIEKEYENNNVEFITEFYRDGKMLVREMNNTDVLSFNVWSMLTHTKPKGEFNEVRIRVATDEEIKEWNNGDKEDIPLEYFESGGK